MIERTKIDVFKDEFDSILEAFRIKYDIKELVDEDPEEIAKKLKESKSHTKAIDNDEFTIGKQKPKKKK